MKVCRQHGQRRGTSALMISGVLVLSLSGLAGCGKLKLEEQPPNPEDARKELAKMNIPYSEPAFIEAAFNGDILPVKLFLAAGMNPNARDPKGRLAYIFTNSRGIDLISAELNTDSLYPYRQAVIDPIPGYVKPELATTPLMTAAIAGRTDIVKELVSRGAKVNAQDGVDKTALFYACWKGHTETARVLLDGGADVNVFEPLFERGATTLRAASYANHVDTASLLLERGAELNPKKPTADTALQAAALGGSARAVEFLLAKGAEVNRKNWLERTALMNAAVKGHPVVVEILIKAGADPNIRDDEGKTAMTLAAREGYKSIVELLKKAGAK